MREVNITFRTFGDVVLRAGLAVGLVALAAGCHQKYWYQEGKTFAECKADHEDCWTELLKRTNLGHTGSYKGRFLENCMQEKGYKLMAEKDLPLHVKREDPDVPSDVPWVHSYGVAGTISAGPLSLPRDRVRAEPATRTHR